MQQKIKVFGLVLLMGFGFGALCQEQTITRNRVKVQQMAKDDTNGKKPRSNSYRQMVALNPLLILTGEFQLSYQYEVYDWMIVEGGTGFTWVNLFADAFTDNFYDEHFDIRYNPAFMGGVKLFPGGNAFDDGGFFGVQANYRQFTKLVDLEEGLTGKTTRYTNDKIYVDFGASIGGQYLTGIDGLVLEYYVGLALRNVTWKRPERFYSTALGADKYEMTTSTYQTVGGLGGVKIGYHF